MENKHILKGWKLPIIAVFGLSFAIFTIVTRNILPEKQPDVIPPKSKFSSNSVAGIGIIEPKNEIINVGVELPGIIRAVNVQIGEKVKKDDLLLVLDQRDIDSQISTLEESLVVSKIQAEDSLAQFTIIDKIKDKNAVAINEFNRLKFASQIAAAKVRESQAKIFQLKVTKERLNIRAPESGSILEVNARVGEYASVGILADPLIRMGDVSTLHVRVEVDEENVSRVKSQSEAVGVPRSNPEKNFPLSFVRFEPYIQPKQNLAVSGQRIDTRVLQIIYALSANIDSVFVGQQMDVFIKENN